MKQTTHHGIQWIPLSELEDLDYADDIALLSKTANHLQKKAQLLTENVVNAELQINQKKTKVMCMNLKERPQIMIDEEELEVVTDFTYLGSNISVENSVQKDISARINKTRNSYCSLRNIWKSNVYSIKTKVRLFNSIVISVLLYGCQRWRVNKNDMHKLDVFQTKCLRRICNIFWLKKYLQWRSVQRDKFSTNKLPDPETQNEMVVPCLENVTISHTKGELRWTHTGKRSKGLPKTTWRRSIIAELSNMGLTMGEAEVIAQNRKRWRNDIVSLCPTWG